MRPTTYMMQRQPYSKWDSFDFALAQAFQLRADEMTPAGVPVWLAHNPDPNISFIVKPTVNRAAAELEQFDEKESKKDVKVKGQARGVEVVELIEDEIKPVRQGGLAREHFYLRMAAAQQEEADLLAAAGIDIEPVRPPGGYDPADYGDGV